MGRSSPEVRKRQRQARAVRGLCPNCPDMLAAGRSMCDACREKMARGHQNRVARRKQRGLCVQCGVRARPGTSLCEAHHARVQQYRQRRITSGGCAYCANVAIPGKTLCRRCAVARQKTAAEKHAAGLCKQTGCRNPVAAGRVNCQPCINKRRERLRALKQQVLDHYGQRCNCACGCQITNFCHLTIDHKNSDGAIQRRLQGMHGGHANYRKIIKAGFPEDLQVLCWNCNCAKEFYGGCHAKAR